ncbi:MAG: hypothetical protein AAGI71_18510 [Bacteroidota bacterium]
MNPEMDPADIAMPPASPDEPAPKRTFTTRRRALWLVAELVVVFLGVYTASRLDDWRQAQRDAEQRAQAIAALHEYFSRGLEEAKEVAPTITAFADSLNAQIERGEQPRLRVFNTGSGYSSSFWEAILASSGEVLPVPLILEVERVQVTTRFMLSISDRLNTLANLYLTPALSDHPDAFYRPDGTLRPEYDWYPDGLRNLASGVQRYEANLDTLVAILEAEIE